MTLFELPEPIEPEPNPLVVAYGTTEGKRCRTCKHLQRIRMGNTWHKCALRTKGGPATDHRVLWKACGKYEEETEA